MCGRVCRAVSGWGHSHALKVHHHYLFKNMKVAGVFVDRGNHIPGILTCEREFQGFYVVGECQR